MKFFKRFILIVFILLLLGIGAVMLMMSFYKKEMTHVLEDNLKTSYGLTLKVGDVDVSLFSNWPNASIKLENVVLINNDFPGKEKEFFKAKSVSLSFHLLKLLRKKFSVKSIAIKDANVNLVKTEEGFKNFQIKKRDSLTVGSSSNISFEIAKILIKNTQFTFSNLKKQQHITFALIDDVIKLKHYQDGVEADLEGNIVVGELLFKPAKGAFLINTAAKLDLHSSVSFTRKEIFIHKPSIVEINKQKYNVASFIELNENKQLVLNIESKNIDYVRGKALLNRAIKKSLENISVTKPIDANILLIAKIGLQQDPIVITRIKSKSNDITLGHSKIPYSDVSFSGSIISLDSALTCGNAEKAKIIFKPLKGKVYGMPFTGSVVLTNFQNPDIKINAEITIDARAIPFKPGQEFVLGGTAIGTLNYSGPVKQLNQQEFLDEPMKLLAEVKFNNISYREKGTPYTYVVNGKAYVNNKELKFDHLALKMNGGTFALKGSVDNFIKYALGYTNGFKAKLDVATDYFNLTPYLVKKKDSSAVQPKQEKNINTVDQSKFEFDVTLAAKKLLIRKVEADHATINMHYDNKLLTLNSLNVNACNGKLSAKGTIYDAHKIEASVVMQNLDVNRLFEQFENFGQKAIESKNLKGNVFVDAKLKMQLDENMEIIGNTMDGEVKIKLKDGHLLNYEPLQKISDFVFRNRDFNDITFSEINETLLVDGFKMEIQEMEIASNVLNLYMSGVYHLKDYSNINLLLPWNNLKKRGKNYVAKESGKNAEDAKGLKLNYSGYPNKLKLSLGNK